MHLLLISGLQVRRDLLTLRFKNERLNTYWFKRYLKRYLSPLPICYCILHPATRGGIQMFGLSFGELHVCLYSIFT